MAMAGALDGGLELVRPWWEEGGDVLRGGPSAAPACPVLLGEEVHAAGDRNQHQHQHQHQHGHGHGHGHEQEEEEVQQEVQPEVLEVVRDIQGNEAVFLTQMGVFLQWTAGNGNGTDAPLPQVSAAPSAPLSYHLLDVLAAYVMAMRTYNMNW
jgi:hypothetical protein